MPSKYNLSSSTVQNRYLGSGGFKGVDFTSSPSFVSPDRFSDAKNVYIDYRNGLGACVETFPGYRIPLQFRVKETQDGNTVDVEIHSMLVWHVNGSVTIPNSTHPNATVSNEDVVAIHAGKRLYIMPIKSLEKDGTFEESEITFPTPQYTNTINGEHRAPFMFCVAFGEDTAASDYESFVSHYNFLPDKPCKMFAESGNLLILGDEGYYRVRMQSGSFPVQGSISVGTAKESRYYFKADHVVKKVLRAYDPEIDPYVHYDGGYIPTTYVNNKAYEQPNLIGDAFSELFTEETVDEMIGDDDGQSEHLQVTRTCTFYPSSKSHFFYGIDDSNSSKISISIDGKNVFEGYAPEGGDRYTHLNITFYYKGTKIVNGEHPDEPFAWFDEVRIRQYFERDIVTGDLVQNEGFVDILHQGSEIRITCDGQSDVPSAILDDFDGAPAEAILGCKVVEHHDGRIFFAGNPRFPNVVFYTQRDLNGKNDPTYVGAQNYFRVGGEGTAIKSMISTSSALIIFKDTGRYQTEASVFYASGVTTESDLLPRVYTVSQGAVGVGCTSEAINFADDICFATENGLYGLNKLQTNLERSVVSRSALINGRFASEDPAVLMTEWEGYLCVYCKSGHMYLADSRQLSSEGYEWFYVDKIGRYKNETKSTRWYDREATEERRAVYDAAGNLVGNADPDLLTNASVLVNPAIRGYFHQSVSADEYIQIPCTYVKDDRGRIAIVIVSTENTGGTFSPATTMITVGNSIWFGSDGYLIILNSDLRGIPNGEDDKDIDPMRLRAKWYNFGGRRYESYVTTYYDDAGIPNLAKSTINRSTIIDMKTIPGSSFKVAVYTERDKWHSPAQSSSTVPDYGDTDFDATSFSGDSHTIVMLREHTNRWARKMYRIYSDEFCRPFGIHRISYQFRVAGRIKDL